MLQALVKAGWTINDVEEADFETLIEVVCKKNQNKPKKIDLMDYMKMEKGVAMS